MSAAPGQPGAIDGATQNDGPSRKASRSPPGRDLCCIFVHAGAGYHSIQNERIHLEACNDAAQMAMMVLRNGGTAVDAVEMAVRVLEDREITNAGYGSNLAMDGVVECDASVVDHLGRSGAVGAVAQIKNPICLARLVLDHTLQPLTLRRVPPNLLVSQGAVEFANELGVPVLPYDALVSPAAQERWLRWKADLKAAERKAKKAGAHSSTWKIRQSATDIAEQEEEHQRLRAQHTRNLLQGYQILDRPSTPPPVDEARSSGGTSEGSAASWPSEQRAPTSESSSSEPLQTPPVAAPLTVAEASRNAFINSTQKVPTISQLREHGSPGISASPLSTEDAIMEDVDRPAKARGSWGDGSSDGSDSASSAKTLKPTTMAVPPAAINTPLPETPAGKQIESPSLRGTTLLSHVKETSPTPPTPATSHPVTHGREDQITDTVGAIAIDSWGNIACGASSGGIGMKYRGRVGPAALVGVGAAVVPVDPDDADRTCVATVTSGTGEHMATTMAATVCAERVYHRIKKGKGGEYVDATEDEAIKSMIDHEFMGIVKNSNSAGAIGILCIRKTSSGIELYYGHNTDSFAMASMHSDELRPSCAMSRSKGNGMIAQGARMLHFRKKTKKTKNNPISR
ncbi:N-terminal nucleophile aminohydrolase [Amniculicola lignicola CBS 123094]|uniref:N-terminal nucleophile aminohydrolase n=1 Tax=Amniculicola lignicola CBS 123094 TaxID=1392246 RepID=A0A6A5WPT6_9PLEO|nr:N-terminal nucleophile aminohydrolase [Amniculicola lignicola CBS 123094]